MSYAFVTLLNSSSYLPGALVLCHALRDLHPSATRKADFRLVCIVTPETVDVASIKELRKAFDEVIGVEVITSGSEGAEDLVLLGRPDLHSALTKLHVFRLGERGYDKVIYLDADVLPLRPIDHLFFDPHRFSACPDIGWPDCFNSGVMVFKPDVKDFDGMMGLMRAAREGAGGVDGALGIGSGNGSFDGADQGLLNEWFSEEGGGGDWHRLSFSYNVTPGAAYSYPPAFKRYGNKIHNIHFIGNNKPWRSIATRPASAPSPHPATLGFDYPSLVDRWFAVYDKHVRPTTDPAVRQTFTVPETQAVWNQRQLAALATPQGRQDLADFARLGSTPKEVRFVVHDPNSGSSEGIYSSLPLDGRVDLMRPQPKPAKPEEPPKEAAPSAAASPPIYAQPLPIEAPINPPNRQGSPPLAVWDAQRSAPPARAGPEFTGHFDSYENAWDRPNNAPKEEWNPVISYPVIPDRVKQDAWYAGAADVPPDRRNVKPVFPWESDRNRTTARVFPKGDTPPAEEEVLPQVATEDVASPSSDSTAIGSVPAPGQPSTPSAIRHQSFSEAIASYTNAWDEIPSIKRYATRLTGGPPRPVAPPATPGPGTVGLPASNEAAGRPRSRRESSNGKRHFVPPLENRSEDGDVEDTSEEDDRSEEGESAAQSHGGRKYDRRGPGGGSAGGPSGGTGHAHRGSTDTTGYGSSGPAKSSGNGEQSTPSANRRYRERSAQTDVVQHRDQRTQTGSPKHRPVFFTSDSSSANLTELGRAKGVGSPPQYGRTSSTDSVTGHFRKALFANAPQGVTEVMTPSIDDEKNRKFFVMQGVAAMAPSASRTTSDEGFSSSTTVVPSSAATSPSKLARATRVFDPATSLDTRKQASLDMLQKFAKQDFR